MKAVMSAFPEIGLDETKFQRLPGLTLLLSAIFFFFFSLVVIYLTSSYLAGYFNDVNVRRESFIQFARANNFDPLVADNWYFSRRKTFLESVFIPLPLCFCLFCFSLLRFCFVLFSFL